MTAAGRRGQREFTRHSGHAGQPGLVRHSDRISSNVITELWINTELPHVYSVRKFRHDQKFRDHARATRMNTKDGREHTTLGMERVIKIVK